MLNKQSARGEINNNKLKRWFMKPFLADRFSHQPDLMFLLSIGLLLFFGLLFLSSASSLLAFSQREQDVYFFVKQQITHGLIPGLVLFYLALRIDYHRYQAYYRWFFYACIFLLILVFIPGLSLDNATARSWIDIGPFSFQTSEFVKLFFILFLAVYLEDKKNELTDFKLGVVPFLFYLGLISFLVMLQPDLGTLSIIITTSLAMYFIAGMRWRHVLSILAAGFLGLVIAIKAAPYRLARLTAFLNPDIDPQGVSYQIRQALIAIGSGGILGFGFGSTRQKLSFVPEPAGDSVFAIIAQESGFIFSTLFIFLFAFFLYRAFKIVKSSPDNFAKLVSLGITIWLSAQIFLNIGSIIGLLPLTGVPLPFVSLGGSNLAITLLAMGIMANISKYTLTNHYHR